MASVEVALVAMVVAVLLLLVVAMLEEEMVEAVVSVMAAVAAVVVAALSLLAQQLPRKALCPSAEVQRHLDLSLPTQQLLRQGLCPLAEVVAMGEMAMWKFAVVMAGSRAAASMFSLQTAVAMGTAAIYCS